MLVVDVAYLVEHLDRAISEKETANFNERFPNLEED